MENVFGLQQSALTVFGGLVGELNAPDIPAGSSPICCDTDFTVGSARTRDGLSSVYQFSGRETGPQNCGSGTQGAGETQWSSPGNITLGDGSFASVSIATPESAVESSGTATNSGLGTAWVNPQNCFSPTLQATSSGVFPYQHLNVSGLGFSIPSSAVITGIQISFNSSIASGARTLVVELDNVSGQGGKSVVVNSSTPQTFTLGGPGDVWGGSPSPSDINLLSFDIGQSGSSTATLSLNNLVVTVFYTTQEISSALFAEQFSFSLSSLPIAGIEVGITGLQAGTPSGSGIVQVQLMKNGVAVGNAKKVNLGASNARIVVGSPTDLWGTTWLNSDVNNTQFGVSIIASNSSAATVSVDLVDCTVFQSAGIFNFNWVSSLDLTEFGGDLLTLALDSTGTLWKEDVTANEGMIAEFFPDITPNSFADGVAEDGRMFIAFSDLQNATDMPRQYDGVNFDRVSQVGPGAPPAIASQNSTYSVAASPNGVTQSPAVGIRRVFWSAAPDTNSAQGNVITVFVSSTAAITKQLAQTGEAIVFLQGIPLMGGQNPNGTYVVTSVGSGQVNGSGGQSPYFTVLSTISVLAQTNDSLAGPTYQLTLATVTTTAPVPNVEVGSQVTLSGIGVPAWDATWTVLFTPNAAQLVITNTSLSGGVATYTFTLVTGSLPSAGEQITITETSNGNGIFNVVNAIIQSATGTQFTVNLNGPNVVSAAESGIAIINGTQFLFEPGSSYVGTGGNPILGNSGGGTLAPTGTLGSGQRMAVVIFKTRNDYITGPSIPVIFSTAGTTTTIVASQIPIGPSDVIARILAFTGANGGNFFYIPDPVTITDAATGQKVTYTSTVVDDNSTTTSTFIFTDAVLLAATGIDVPGNNLFEQIELGDPVGVITYGNRLFWWGEENKVQNLVNPTFDGGYLPNSVALLPLGWTVDAVNGAGGQLRTSPLFGNSYYILNSSGSAQALWGMIEQGAFQDYYKTPIIEANETYGIRATCRCPSGITGSGALNIDLFSPSLNKIFGVFSLALSAMTTAMQKFTGNMLTTAISGQVPADLILRLYLSNVPAGGDCEIDRFDVYPLSQPVLSTQLRASYEGNFEAYDDLTGNLGIGTQNQQPIVSAFTMFDNLYIVKSNSFYETSDNGVTEPFFWTVREISKKVGTCSIHGVNSGEAWELTASQNGIYLFEGGAPVKIMPEIDPIWKTINWNAGKTVWIRNDTNNRKMYVGVPVPTPNQWMPKFPANSNPTTPNVVLVCNYKELMSAGAIEQEGPVRLTFMGDLRTYQLGRKWSAWSIQAGYADFVERDDQTTPLFFCGDTETGKIYKQTAGNFLDDGAGMHCQYVTYPFPKTQEAQALGFGMNMLDAHLMTMLITGSGSVNLTIYPDTLNSPYTDTLASVPVVPTPAYGDTEVPLNETGSRFFVGIEPVNPGDNFEISRIVLALKQAAWSPVRGSN